MADTTDKVDRLMCCDQAMCCLGYAGNSDVLWECLVCHAGKRVPSPGVSSSDATQPVSQRCLDCQTRDECLRRRREAIEAQALIQSLRAELAAERSYLDELTKGHGNKTCPSHRPRGKCPLCQVAIARGNKP